MLEPLSPPGKLHHKRALCTEVANMTIAPCAIVMVGLPARGKTYMAKKLARYFKWIGIETRVFNVGEYRRKAVTNFTNSMDFFHPENVEASHIRENCAKLALDDLISWLQNGGEVAIYDATNSNRARRRMIVENLTTMYGFKILFIESVCSDPEVIEANIREVKVSSPDYQNAQKEAAIEDFKERIKVYESQYETLDEEHDRDLSYIKIYNQGEKYLVNRIQGHVQSRAVYFLMNIHVLPRTFYLSRAGETDMNVADRIGGGGTLTERGQEYAVRLGEFICNQPHYGLRVWTSLSEHTIQTAAFIDKEQENWKALNELDAGFAEGMTYAEVKENFPDEYRKRQQDKYRYRYAAGESYTDVVARLEPVIMELERQENVLVICDQAVARCILGYFMEAEPDTIPYINVPLHQVLKLTPLAYGCKIEGVHFGVDAVSTFKEKPPVIEKLSSSERRQRRRQTSECGESTCCPSRTPSTA